MRPRIHEDDPCGSADKSDTDVGPDRGPDALPQPGLRGYQGQPFFALSRRESNIVPTAFEASGPTNFLLDVQEIPFAACRIRVRFTGSGPTFPQELFSDWSATRFVISTLHFSAVE